jgi:hypothetical protein
LWGADDHQDTGGLPALDALLRLVRVGATLLASRTLCEAATGNRVSRFQWSRSVTPDPA